MSGTGCTFSRWSQHSQFLLRCRNRGVSLVKHQTTSMACMAVFCHKENQFPLLLLSIYLHKSNVHAACLFYEYKVHGLRVSGDRRINWTSVGSTCASRGLSIFGHPLVCFFFWKVRFGDISAPSSSCPFCVFFALASLYFLFHFWE